MQRPTGWSCQIINRLRPLSTAAKIAKATGMFNTEGCTSGELITAGNPYFPRYTHTQIQTSYTLRLKRREGHSSSDDLELQSKAAISGNKLDFSGFSRIIIDTILFIS